MRGNWNDPESPVVAVSGWSSVGPVSVTVTPGSTAPDSSTTLPKTSPVCCCAAAAAAHAKSATNTRAPNLTFILPPCANPGMRSPAACDCSVRGGAEAEPLARGTMWPLVTIREHGSKWYHQFNILKG